MNRQKRDLIKMIVWISICMSLIVGIAIYSNCTHTEEKESQQSDTTLVSLEDSVQYYEDGL